MVIHCGDSPALRYKAEGNDRKITQNEEQIEDIKREINMGNDARATIESTIAGLQDDLSRASSLNQNISANLRYRNEDKEIQKVQDELDEIDIESAARARKDFNARFKEKLEEETNVKDKVCETWTWFTASLKRTSGNWRAGS